MPRLPQLGRRGGGWVALQALLVVAVLLSALVGVSLSAPLRLAADVVGGVAIAAGGLLLAAGGAGLGRALTPFPAPRGGEELRTTGVYGRARHPMYGGAILFVFGWAILFASPLGLVLAAVVLAFLELKSRREEQWLERHHAGYAAYRRRVRHRFLPLPW